MPRISAQVSGAVGDSGKIIVLDTTLRDGFRSLTPAIPLAQRIAIAEGLVALGVDIIEVGFNCQTDQELTDVQKIARYCGDAVVCALGAMDRKNLTRAHTAIAPARRGRLHTFTPVSDRMIRRLGLKERDAALEAISTSVRYARTLQEDIQWAAFDASSADTDFLCRAVETAIEAGAGTVSLPDTPGKSTPFAYAALFAEVITRVPNAHAAIFATHCHNDRGLATANTLCAVEHGARQVECTLLGVGERAGNAALEEVMMLLPGHETIPLPNLVNAATVVAKATGFSIPPNKPIVGGNAYFRPETAEVHRVGS